MTSLSRRSFLQASAATAAALTLGTSRWGWAIDSSPFGPLQDDPILRLPQGFSYKIVAETGIPLEGGRGPALRPHFPDLNVAFKQSGGKILLSTSHEVQAEAPVGQLPPEEEYDRLACGAITSLLLNPDLSIAESAYNAGGMVNNCSGGSTPWGTVLTGEEATSSLEADHGFVWEVDPNKHTKVRLDACGRFEHETAIRDPKTGYVYLTEDSGTDSFLYRMIPKDARNLSKGGVLQAYAAGGSWVVIDDPTAEKGPSPAAQAGEQNALDFARLEGGLFSGRWFYFTETEDDTACGKVWRLNADSGKLELWAEGSKKAPLCMPDNLALDAADNLFVCEDKGDAGPNNPNHLFFIDKTSGDMALFAELVVQASTPVVNAADEPTGSCFSPDGKVLFLNLQRGGFGGLTLGITGPFAKWPKSGPRAMPRAAMPAEAALIEKQRISLPGMSVGEAAAWTRLFRLGRVEDVPADIAALAKDLGPLGRVATPKRRASKTF